MSLYDSNGKRKDVIPIEKYPDISKPSGIEKRLSEKPCEASLSKKVI